MTTGFTWDDYVTSLVEREGTLAAVAEKLAAAHNFADDVASVERALRRLRGRELRPGGKWGTRLVALFGLPSTVERRLRWMAAYHSRFADLPVPVCEDLVRLWDHPPTTERLESRSWLALARASIALRKNDHDQAETQLASVRGELDVGLRVEHALVRAYLAREAAAPLLDDAARALATMPPDDDRACLLARLTDQRAHALNRAREHAAAEALFRALPIDNVPPFARCRRAGGLAYARWKQGHIDEAAAFARDAATHAGDGGHVRLRVMALAMLARIDPREHVAHERAVTIARRLEDETLLFRLTRG